MRTYSIPKSECHAQVIGEALAVLKPFLTLLLRLSTHAWGGRVGVLGEIVKVCSDSDSKSTVVVVNEWEAR